jgi:hypothetical protein
LGSINVIPSPQAFNNMSSNSFVQASRPEANVEAVIQDKQPAMYLGNKLTGTNLQSNPDAAAQVHEKFMGNYDERRLPNPTPGSLADPGLNDHALYSRRFNPAGSSGTAQSAAPVASSSRDASRKFTPLASKEILGTRKRK